jgi:redox-sensitive bicupin YhaK (pirin superfamily)
MFTIRRSGERGHFNHGWLDTYHTFSFSDYYDPEHMGFRSLRVMNEDRVDPGQGFGMHPHRDMEIVTYVLEGELEHRDSLGNGEVLRPGEFQRMTAGTGIRHSEFNPSRTKPVHLYQIWLLPRVAGLKPSYEQCEIPEAERQGRLRLVASPDGKDGSLTIQQDARVYLSTLAPDSELKHGIDRDRHVWLQVLRGTVTIGGKSLGAGDGLAVSDEPGLVIAAKAPAEVMLFDLA